MKTCTKCHKSKPLSEYSKKGRGNKLRADCKECNNLYNRTIQHKYTESKLERKNLDCKEVNDRYIKKTLRQTNLPITPELIELKRLSILTSRLCKKTSKN